VTATGLVSGGFPPWGLCGVSGDILLILTPGKAMADGSSPWVGAFNIIDWVKKYLLLFAEKKGVIQ